jgi:hypothetical protein
MGRCLGEFKRINSELLGNNKVYYQAEQGGKVGFFHGDYV